MENKEDLIGTIWTCPRCSKDIEITEKGLKHQCNENGFYYANMSLATYYHYKKAYLSFMKEFERKLMYNE